VLGDEHINTYMHTYTHATQAYTAQICSALAYCHAHNIVHRDIKGTCSVYCVCVVVWMVVQYMWYVSRAIVCVI
jgi:hypothetical protein